MIPRIGRFTEPADARDRMPPRRRFRPASRSRFRPWRGRAISISISISVPATDFRLRFRFPFPSRQAISVSMPNCYQPDAISISEGSTGMRLVSKSRRERNGLADFPAAISMPDKVIHKVIHMYVQVSTCDYTELSTGSNQCTSIKKHRGSPKYDRDEARHALGLFIGALRMALVPEPSSGRSLGSIIPEASIPFRPLWGLQSL